MHETARPALQSFLDDPECEIKFDRAAKLLCNLNDESGLEELLDLPEARRKRFWHVYDAGLKIASGQRWDCSQALKCPAYESAWMPRYMRGLDTFRLVWGPPKESIAPEINFHSVPRSEVDTICIVSCDANYLKIFGKSLIESFQDVAGPTDGLHIHCCNMDAEQIKNLGLDGLRFISISSDHAGDVAPAYFACARFFAARELMERVDGYFILLDFDIIFKRSPTGLFRFDPAMRARRVKSPKLPWQVYIANFKSFYNSHAAKVYLDRFSDISLPILARHDLSHWYIDQNVMAALIYQDGFMFKNEWTRSGDLYSSNDALAEHKDVLR